MFAGIFLLFFTLSSYVCDVAYIPVFMNDLNTGHRVFSADIMIGTQPKIYRLQIDFSFDKISIFHDISEVSSTWVSGYDEVFFDHRHYKVPVLSDPGGDITKPQLKNEYRCRDCDGVLGLSYRSTFFKIFGEIAFSNKYITLGKDPQEMKAIPKKAQHHTQCQRGKKSLCVTTGGTLSFNNVHYTNLSIDIDPSSQKLILPAEIFDEYMRDKNAYDSRKWEPITIRSYDMDKWDTLKNEPESLEYVIDPKHFIHLSRTGTKLLGIDRDETGSQQVTISSRVLSNFIIERSIEGLALSSFATFNSPDNVNIFFFVVLLILILRWTFTNLNLLDMTVKDFGHYRAWYQIWYEWLGVVISIVAIFLPQTFDLLENHLDLYIGTWFLLGFSVLSKIIIKVYYSFKKNKNYFLYRFKSPYLRLINSFFEQVIMLTGLWILVLQTRTEGGDSVILLITNLVLLFVISYYFKIAVYYTITIALFSSYSKKVYLDLVVPKFKKELGIFIFFTACAYIYQVLIAVNFFARPFFIKNLNLEDKFAIPVMMLLYIFTEIVSTLFLILDVQYTKMLHKKKKDI